MGSIVSGSSRTALPQLLSHEEALTEFLSLIELIMTSFNVKRTTERYFNNLIIQMKDGELKRLKYLLLVTT